MEATDTSWQIGDSIGFGWERFKTNVGLLLGVLVVMVGINIAFTVVLRQMDQGFAQSVVLLASWVVSIVIGMGVLRVALKIVDEEPSEIADLFVFDSSFFAYLVTSLIVGFAIFVGLIFFIIPGIMIALAWGFYGFPIVDQDALVGESITISANVTKGHRWHLFGFGIVLWLLNILGFITIVGWLITVPVSVLAVTAVYRRMSGVELVRESV